MPAGEFFLRFQHGIQGGFAPPTPNAIHTITQEPSGSNCLTITSAVRPDGTADLQNLAPKAISSKEDTAALLEELYGILKTIPTELPPGSEDIYGLDTSIAWFSDDLQWVNGGPDGCAHGTSEVQPSEEQKAKFKRAVEVVNILIGKST